MNLMTLCHKLSKSLPKTPQPSQINDFGMRRGVIY